MQKTCSPAKESKDEEDFVPKTVYFSIHIVLFFRDGRLRLRHHGEIGYRLQGETTRVTIPAVPGHTFDLPDRFFLVAGHANPAWDTAGAYLPPCSSGRGNQYYVTVKAVYDAPKGEQSKLLGSGKLQMGSY